MRWGFEAGCALCGAEQGDWAQCVHRCPRTPRPKGAGDMAVCFLKLGNAPEGWTRKVGSFQERGEVDWGSVCTVDGGACAGVAGGSRRVRGGRRGDWSVSWGRWVGAQCLGSAWVRTNLTHSRRVRNCSAPHQGPGTTTIILIVCFPYASYRALRLDTWLGQKGWARPVKHVAKRGEGPLERRRGGATGGSLWLQYPDEWCGHNKGADVLANKGMDALVERAGLQALHSWGLRGCRRHWV